MTDNIIRGHESYWNLLGSIRGNENHRGNVSWLSGEINYNYSVKLVGPDYAKEAEEIVQKIKARQIPPNLTVSPYSAPSGIDVCELFLSYEGFNIARLNLGMAKKIVATKFKIPNEINVFFVRDLN
ncbi:MAG: hypothetical protein LBI27_10105, partial [Clostridiales bacterium]|nr:hypothetical protein [Clostridiales bacterium]